MQEQHIDALMSKFKDSDFKDMIANSASDFADKIAAETTNLPSTARTPNATEILEIREWIKDYRKMHPKASRREIRRATQKKFNITILPNTNI